MSSPGPAHVGPTRPISLELGTVEAALIRSYWNDDWNNGVTAEQAVTCYPSSAKVGPDQSRRIDTSSRTAARSKTSSNLSS
jgi:hypothetical protein